MLIFPKALSVNEMRHVKAKSINLHTRRKLIEYYFKKCQVKVLSLLIFFKILLFEGRLLLSPVQRGTVSGRIRVSVKTKSIF